MKHRLYLAPEQIFGVSGAEPALITLTRDQSHYLTRVLRLRPGATLLCFDGEGTQWHAQVQTADGRRCALELTGLERREPTPRGALVLAQSWLKGSAMDVVMQKATELGATDIYPLLAARGTAHIDAERVANRLAHWKRITISAAEQCGRVMLPAIHEPRTIAELFNSPPTPTCLFLVIGQSPLNPGATAEPVTLLAGPEGGWTDEERELARNAGALAAGLGDLVLRAETAPLAALAAIQQSWGWQR